MLRAHKGLPPIMAQNFKETYSKIFRNSFSEFKTNAGSKNFLK
jgi:hypothetical protein